MKSKNIYLEVIPFIVFSSFILIAVNATAVSQTLIEPAYASTGEAEPVEAHLPPNPCGLDVIDCDGEVKGTVREVSAYTSEPDQTDDTPCIAADGSDICARYEAGELICAANFVPLGTKITIDHYGTCTVADRMNRRYTSRVDVYLGMDTPRALRFGVQKLLVN